VEVPSLALIASEHGIPVVHDLGSGLMMDLTEFGLSGEPTARAALEAGATLVMMSGDKLLGGPQAGIILGARHAVARLRQEAFARAMRVDKLTIAALAATLELYREPARALRDIPALAMISTPSGRIRERCESLAGELGLSGIHSSVIESMASVGAGAFPIHGIPSFSLALGGEPQDIERRLRLADMPVIGRIAEGRLLLDMRSVPERDDAAFTSAIKRALA
jgi:L-seryl-tRNA(Ser) seleniumtransferase